MHSIVTFPELVGKYYVIIHFVRTRMGIFGALCHPALCRQDEFLFLLHKYDIGQCDEIKQQHSNC